MAKEVLDVIDTAVKIGLGASIGGIAAYFMAKLKYKQEVDKSTIDDQRSLIKSLSDAFEKSTYGTDQIVSERYLFINGEQKDLNEFRRNVSELSMNSMSHIESAKSISNILGNEELFQCFSEYMKLLVTMQNNAMRNPPEESGVKEDEYIHQGQELRNRIYPLITKAYRSIGA